MARIKAIFISMFFILLLPNVHRAQRDIQLTLPFPLQFGGEYAKVQRDSLSHWNQKLGLGLILTAGFGATYKRIAGAEVFSSLTTNSYSFSTQGAQYSVTNLITSVGGHAYFLIPLRLHDGRYLNIGTDIGRAFQSSDQLTINKEKFFVLSTSESHVRPYFSPEIGITNFKKRHSFAASITYYYSNTSNSLMEINLRNSNGTYANLRQRVIFWDVNFVIPIRSMAMKNHITSRCQNRMTPMKFFSAILKK